MIELHPELARSIVHGLPVGVAVVDPNGRVVWANAVLSDLLETSLQEMLGCSADSLQLPLPKADQASTDQAFQVNERAGLLSISRTPDAHNRSPQTLLVMDREHAIDWFFDALATGSFDGSAASRFLSRNALSGRLQIEISRSRRYGNPLSCLVIRLDFTEDASAEQHERVNDQIATSLIEQLRWVDVLGAWSPNTLVVVLPETIESAALRLSAKIAETLRTKLGLQIPHIGISVGASSWRKGDDGEGLIRRGDISARRQVGSTARTIRF